MRHNIFNSKVPPQHTQKKSTFQTERKYILPETQVRLDTNVKAFTSKRTCVF